MSTLRSAIGLFLESMSGLTPNESKLLGLMTGKKKLRDKEIRTEMGLEQGQLLKLSVGLRAKLGIPDYANVRDFITKSRKSTN